MAVQLNWNLFFVAFLSCLSHIECLALPFSSLCKLVSHFFIVQVPTGFLITVSLFALAYVQKSFNRSDVFSTYRIFQLDETARYDDCLWQNGFQVGGHPVSEVFWPPVNLSLSACTCVSCFLFLTLSRYPMCTKFEIVYPRDLPVSEWVDSKIRAHLIRIIRWKTHCSISSTWHSSD